MSTLFSSSGQQILEAAVAELTLSEIDKSKHRAHCRSREGGCATARELFQAAGDTAKRQRLWTT